MRYATTVAVAVLAFAVPARAASVSTLKERESRQTRALARYQGTLRFFDNHQRLLYGRTWRVARREIRRARIWIRVIRSELAQTRAELAVRSWPPHHNLWLCIHGHEAGDWQNQDTGHNGHYGGLQMHLGWGYGTSYDAGNDSQWTQEWAAERGYAASGYNHAWLLGQWYHPDCMWAA